MTCIISWAMKPYIRLSVEPPYNCWWVSFHLNLTGLNCIRVSRAVPLTSPWMFFNRESDKSLQAVPPTVLPALPVTCNVLELGFVVPMPTLPVLDMRMRSDAPAPLVVVEKAKYPELLS